MGKVFFRTNEISPGITKITGAADEGMFLVEGSERALLFDVGIGCGEVKQFADTLTSLSIEYVVISHAHADHIGGVAGIDKIWINDKDRELIPDGIDVDSRCNLMKAIERQHNKIYGFTRADFPKAEAFAIQNVSAGDYFDLGDRLLEVIEVPGHTRGSIALIDRKNRILLSGDAFNQSTFVWGEESLTLSEYVNMLHAHLEKWRGKYDYIYGAHDSCPDPASLVEDVLEAAEGVLSGKYPGVPYEFGERNDLLIAKPPREHNIGCADGRLGNVVFSRNRLYP